MSVDFNQLQHPESLSKEILLEILESRCINIPMIKSLDKVDLLQMVYRIALPKPQRKYNESKQLGKKLQSLRLNRNIAIATEEEENLYQSVIACKNKSLKEIGCKSSSTCDEDNYSASKKICLSKTPIETNGSLENGLKRKFNNVEVSSLMENKKHKKITWP